MAGNIKYGWKYQIWLEIVNMAGNIKLWLEISNMVGNIKYGWKY